MTSLESLSYSSMTSQTYQRPRIPTRRPKTGGLAARGPTYLLDLEKRNCHLGVTGHGMQCDETPHISTERHDVRHPFSTIDKIRPKTATSKSTPSTSWRSVSATGQRRKSDSLAMTSTCFELDTVDDTRIGRPELKTGHTSKETNRKIPGCLTISMDVDHMDITMDGESWNRTYQRKLLMLQIILLRDSQIIIANINAKFVEFGITELSVTKLIIGTVHIRFTDAKCVNQFRDFVADDRLTDLLNDVIIGENFLREVGVEMLTLTAIVDPRDIARCHRELQKQLPTRRTTKKDMRGNDAIATVMETNKPLDGCATPRNSPVPMSSDIEIIDILTTLLTDIAVAESRYNIFQRDIGHFFMTLKLVKPVELNKFQCLGDILHCFRYLQCRDVIRNNVREDLVNEYLTIINILRIKVDVTEHKLKRVDDQASSSIQESIEKCKQVQTYFAITFQFESSEETTIVPEMNAMDKKLFGNLVQYVPHLLHKIVDIANCLASHQSLF